MLQCKDKTILVVDPSRAVAEHVKELIEFMDSPRVVIARPGDWRAQLGDHRLEALFVGPDLSDEDVRKLLSDLARLDPNVPVVMMSEAIP